MWGVCKRNGDQPLLLQAGISRRVVEANRPALFRLSSTCLTSLQSQSVNVSSKTRCCCGDQLKFTWIRFCRAPREEPKAMAEHNCPFFLPLKPSRLPKLTTTVQNECELKSAPICSPRRQFGAKLCEYVPLSAAFLSLLRVAGVCLVVNPPEFILFYFILFLSVYILQGWPDS